ncbi:MAG: aminopeptidase [bacterium]|nr:aminopeptidase [bacterium]
MYSEDNVERVPVHNPGYYFALGKKQLHIITHRESLDELLKKKDLTDTEKEKYLFVKTVSDFCTNELKLSGEDTYSKIYDTGKKPIAWNLTVAPSLSLKPVKWRYPVVGEFPYIGFFDKESAEKEEKTWVSKGYDTFLRPVSAFSTLGWFKDPIYSPMLNYDAGTLAEIIIHERIHNTIFLKNQMEFNESVAEFLGSESAKYFLIKTFGKASEEYQYYMDLNSDQKLFFDFINVCDNELSEIYLLNITTAEKLRKKDLKIKELTGRYKELPFKNKGYSGYLERTDFNNAFIVAHKTYSTDQKIFSELFEYFNSDPVKMIEFLKTIPEKRDGYQFIVEFLSTHQK